VSAAVIVAAPSCLRSVLAVVMDWSASSLLTPMHWVEPDDHGQLTVTNGLFVHNGRLTAEPIDAPLLRGQVDRVRLLVLVPTWKGAESISAAAEASVREAVRRAAPGVQVTPIRVLLTVGDQFEDDSAPDVMGWHNVIVSPETSAQPGGFRQVHEHRDLIPLVAASVASLGGLWTGVDTGPLDGQQTPPQGWPRLYRTQILWLDARRAEMAMRDELLHPPEIPPPTRSTGAACAVLGAADVPVVTKDFADRLLSSHARLFESQRAQPAAEQTRTIGILDALGMFVTFLVSMFRPVDWLRARLARGKEVLASAVGDAVFGHDSRYVVKFGSGSLGQQHEALTRLESGLATRREISFESTGDFSGLWREFVDGALTLIDAGSRAGTLHPVPVGGSRGVLPRTIDCAPTPGSGFVVDPALGLPRSSHQIPAWDRVELVSLDTVLGELADGEDALSTIATRERARLREWVQQNQHSYAARVGSGLERRFRRVSTEIQELLARLTTKDDRVESQLAEQQRRLARQLQIILGIVVTGIVVTGVLGGVGLVEAATVGWLLGGLVVGWLAASLTTFMLGQRALFRELERRRMLVSRREADEENLRKATFDLRRLVEAYRQFLGWAEVVSAVIAEPFGARQNPRPAAGHRLADLPLNVRVAELSIDARQQSRAVALLQRSFFGTGWLSRPWESTLADAGHRLGPDALSLIERPDRMFGEPGNADSRLIRWAAMLSREGVGSAPADEAWVDVAARLVVSADELQLIENGVCIGPGGQAQAAADFAAARRVLAEQTGSPFDERVLTPAGVVQGGNQVEWFEAPEHRHGLSRLTVRSDLGPGIEPHLLRRAGGSNGSTRRRDWFV